MAASSDRLVNVTPQLCISQRSLPQYLAIDGALCCENADVPPARMPVLLRAGTPLDKLQLPGHILQASPQALSEHAGSCAGDGTRGRDTTENYSVTDDGLPQLLSYAQVDDPSLKLTTLLSSISNLSGL